MLQYIRVEYGMQRASAGVGDTVVNQLLLAVQNNSPGPRLRAPGRRRWR
jgi:hypothetical protein